MDVAALSLSIDSSSVVKAAADLDKFSAASAKAGAMSSGQSGSIARLVASVQSMNAKLGAVVSALDRMAAANDNVATSSKASAAAVNSVSGSMRASMGPLASAAAAAATVAVNFDAMGRASQQADAHVQAFRARLASVGPVMQQANAHVLAYRNNLATLPPAFSNAAQSAGELQANTGNIAAQFQDIGVTAAMGMNPLLIGLQQGTQLSAVFAQSGGSMKQVLVGAFRQIASAMALATIGMTALIAVVIQLAMEWYNSSKEGDNLAKSIESIKLASDGVSDAQSILGKVFDLTTGKMKTQSAAAINLARTQLLLMKATAQVNISKAAGELDTAGNLGFGGRLSAWLKNDRALIDGSARVDQLTKALKNNQISGEIAAKGFQMLYDRGEITNEMFLKGTAAAANYGAEIENVRTATQALADLESGSLSSLFLDPAKPKKGGKTQAERLSDVFRGAEAEIAAEKVRALGEANNVSAFEAARLEKQTALLNSIQQKGIPITEAARKKVAELADEYAKFKTAADVSASINAANNDAKQQVDALEDQIKLVGLYGEERARVEREMEAQRKLRESLPRGEIAVVPNLTGRVSDKIEELNRDARLKKIRKDAEDTAYALDLERQGLGLTGAAAESYAFVVDRLNEAKRAGIELSPEEVAAIKAAGDAYGTTRIAIERQREAIAGAREVTKGFFSDWINGVREGGNIFKSFADSVVNSLNRIIDKLLDRTLDSFLDGMFSQGGGMLGNILGGGGSSGLVSTGKSIMPSLGSIFKGGWGADPQQYALGGAFANAQRFAKGGAFTNSIVNTPTLFRFANGAALGEMGEAGPEAIMPLKRGPNGSLGVQAHGGGSRRADVSIKQDFHFTGTVGPNEVAAMVRQGAASAVQEVKRNLDAYLREWEIDGAVST